MKCITFGSLMCIICFCLFLKAYLDDSSFYKDSDFVEIVGHYKRYRVINESTGRILSGPFFRVAEYKLELNEYPCTFDFYNKASIESNPKFANSGNISLKIKLLKKDYQKLNSNTKVVIYGLWILKDSSKIEVFNFDEKVFSTFQRNKIYIMLASIVMFFIIVLRKVKFGK